ncbi:MAG: tol-pal system protein YbgF [Hyphomicrobiales bacterium]|nr:tol-pal system protein YbgF [Hyphomicrobiales bacterium]
MQTRKSRLIAFALLAASTVFWTPALAQEAPGQPRIQLAQFFNRAEQQPAGNGETADLLLRVDRLENQIRSLNGQIEQMQFQVRRTEEMMKKFQQDVDFRFQEQSGGKAAPRQAAPAAPGRRSEIEPDTSNDLAGMDVAPEAGQRVAAAPMAGAPAAIPGGATPRGGARNDAFDPSALPDAPGAPRPLGSPASASAPLPPVSARAGGYPAGPLSTEDDPNAPLDLAPGIRARRSTAMAEPPMGAMPPAATTPAVRPLQGTTTAALPPTTPRDEFDVAMASLNQGQYETAETGLKTFLQRYPKDRLSGEAVFYLGESYFKRGRSRDAAEQYLKISTDHPKTAHAPDALVRLGVSLEKLGAKEQACAFFSEVGRKYPAATTVKASAQREAKRVQC